MMAWLLFKRDLLLAFRRGGNLFAALAFALTVFTVFAFGFGPERLSAAAASVLVVTVLFASILTAPNLFEHDAADGSLEQYVLQPAAFEWLIFAKLSAFWLTSALPLVMMTPILAVMAGMEHESVDKLTLILFIVSPALTSIGALGGALTLNLQRGGFTQALILLPLYVPLLVFAAHASTGEGALLLLAAITLISVPVACLLCSVILKISQD